jgi:hypothetical protein
LQRQLVAKGRVGRVVAQAAKTGPVFDGAVRAAPQKAILFDAIRLDGVGVKRIRPFLKFRGTVFVCRLFFFGRKEGFKYINETHKFSLV